MGHRQTVGKLLILPGFRLLLLLQVGESPLTPFEVSPPCHRATKTGIIRCGKGVCHRGIIGVDRCHLTEETGQVLWRARQPPKHLQLVAGRQSIGRIMLEKIIFYRDEATAAQRVDLRGNSGEFFNRVGRLLTVFLGRIAARRQLIPLG